MSDWAGGGWVSEPYVPPPQNELAIPGTRRVASFGASTRFGATGIVAGRFMPPHAGHQYVIDTALASVEKLTIMVVGTPGDVLSQSLRVHLLQKQYPKATVRGVELDVPPGSSTFIDQFVKRTRESGAHQFFFGSEPGYAWLATAIGATYVPVDPTRAAVPISGTAIRANIVEHYRHLIPSARPYFVRRVAIVGAESTGKTTLAARLREEFKTVAVPEWTRTLVENDPVGVTSERVQLIARSQIALEDALAADADGTNGGVMFCDTDLYTMYLWSRRMFDGWPPSWITDEEMKREYDLYLLCMPDIPFVGPANRDLPIQRREMHDALVLRVSGKPHVELYGSRDERFRAAADAVIGLFSPGPLLSERARNAPGWL